MKNRFGISLVLMLVSMVLLAAFQGWWLYKSYREEKETMEIRTSILFRETLYGLQAAKLKLDTNFHFSRMPSRTDAVGVVNVLRAKALDTLRRQMPPGKVMISMNTNTVRTRRDRDTTVTSFVRYAPDKIFDVLLASESAQDSLKMEEIQSAFSKSLKAQQINVPYTVSRSNAAMMIEKQLQPEPLPSRRPDASRPNVTRPDVTIGFMYPVTYQLELGNAFPYLIGKIAPELAFAIFLLTVTIMSFLMLYRNLAAQKKLAGIKNDFISNITHELKTPIATVSVAIEALKNFNALHDPQKTREYLDISQNELQRLSLLVDKVLKLSMFENKAIELKPEVLDLRSIVDDVAASMRLQLEKYKAQLSVESNGNALLKGDKLHLTSVVFNLLDNALKYSKSYPSIRIEIKELDNMVQLEMIDNGIGIAPEYRDRIFEKFFRIPAGDTHNAKGYGLGLSYVAHVVQKHQGTIEVESQPGIGSRFTVKLPKAHE
jgi:two-component system, OmpR family, phosphate regulon sensor histidine kinase PhoR